MTMQEQLRQLVVRHHANLLEQIATVGRLLDPVGEPHGALAVARVVEAQGITHQMKGTAGSMGFAAVGAAASTLDESLKVLKRASAPLPAPQVQPALDLLDSLRKIAEATPPEKSTLYNADLSRLAR